MRLERMMLVPASDIFSGLTDCQMSALVKSLDNGYYSLPSEIKVEMLAQGAGLAPSTFSEHLRKAESRILMNLRPYLQAYFTKSQGELAMEVPARIRSRSKRRLPT